MTRYELKLEESFLKLAKEEGVPLRFSLANRERLTGTVTVAGRYDLGIESDGRVITLPKKEVSHISPARQLLDESFFKAPSGDETATSRSRVQDEFLARYVTEKTLALLRLVNGDELRGVVEGFDGFTLSLRTSRGQMLIYKHGLLSVGPGYRRHTGKEDEH